MPSRPAVDQHSRPAVEQPLGLSALTSVAHLPGDGGAAGMLFVGSSDCQAGSCGVPWCGLHRGVPV